ncbi:hypothetical protein HYT55_00580 [Candidatus Woesearchaeota archaeon]|nr:hypothetical protein [Candidatus Woesearchaeota archaeon]
MPSPAYQRHLAELQQIQDCKPLPFFDLTDLERIVRSSDTNSTDALSRKAIYPHSTSASQLLHQLTAMRSDLGQFRNHEEDLVRTYGLQYSSYQFNFPIAHGEIREALQTVYPLISTLTESVDQFSQLHAAAERDITHKIHPNLIVGKQYLAEARLLIPVAQPHFGIRVFTLRPKKDTDHPSFDIEQASDNLYATLDLALRKETDPRRLETVLVVQNTEQYSLPETVLPILVGRYVRMIGSTEKE